MAHFLEHLVFKGGEKYDDYRKVNETAERMGAVLNAYTSHDLVAFHITCRAEVVAAGDRPADRLRRPPEDRRRRARPRARRRDPGDRARQGPAVGRRRAPDRPRRVRRPPARPAGARPRGAPAQSFTRDAIVAFRERQWAGSRGGAFLVGNLDHVPDDAALEELFGALPDASQANGGYEPAPEFEPQTLVEERDSNQSHLRISYRPQVDAARPRAARRADDLLDAAGRLDGLAPVRRDPRAARARLLRLLGRPRVRRRADPAAVGRASSRASASRPTTRMREIVDELRDERAARGGVRARPRLRRRAARAGVREHQRGRPLRGRRRPSIFGEDIDPDRAIRLLDETTLERVAEVARGISVEASVACVGPHEVSEFE